MRRQPLSHVWRWEWWGLLVGLMMHLTGGVARADAPLEPFHWQVFTFKDTLMGRFRLTDITEDREGRMWFASWGGGVAVYDGLSWRHFHSANSLLTSDVVFDVHAHSDGLLYFATDKGVSRYNPATGDWRTFRAGKNGPAHPRVISITADKEGRLWFGTSGGMSRFDPKTSRWDTLTPHNSELADNKIRQVLWTRDGSLWIVYPANGISRYDPKRNIWGRFMAKPGGLANNDINKIFEASDGNLYMSLGGSGGLNIYDPKQGVWRLLTPENTPLLNSRSMTSLAEASGGRVWLGTALNGIRLYDPQLGRCVANLTTQNSRLASDSMSKVAMRSDGTLWVGHFNGSVSILDLRPPLRSRFASSQEAPSPSPIFPSISCLPDGSLWVAGKSGPVLYDAAIKLWRTFSPDVCPCAGNAVAALAVSKDRKAACATRQCLAVYNPATKQWQTLKSFQPTQEIVNHLLWRSDGTLWLARREGVEVYDPRSRHWASLPFPHPTGAYVTSLLQTSNAEAVWCATYGRGVYRRDLKTGQWQHFTKDNSGLVSDWIYDVFEHADGSLWFGTDVGISIYTGGQWQRMDVTTTQHALPSNKVHDLCASKDGRIWCATDSGVGIFDGENWGTVTAQDGLPQDYCNALCAAPDGSVWAVMGSRLVRLSVPSVTPETFLVTGDSVHYRAIEGAKTFRFSQKPNDKESASTLLVAGRHLHPQKTSDSLPVVTADTPTCDVFALNPWRNDPQEEFWFSYRLDGESWKPFQHGTHLVIEGLTNGEHILWVRAKNRWLNVDGTPAVYIFRVQIPPARWVIVLMQASLGGLFFALAVGAVIYRQRTRHVKELKKTLDELTTTQEQLANSQKLAAIGEMATGIAHEVKQPLSALYGHSWLLRVRAEQLSMEQIKHSAEILMEESQRLNDLIDELRDYAKPRQYELAQEELVPIVEQVLTLARFDLLVQRMEVVTDYQAQPKVMVNRDKIKQVLLNLLRNAAQAAQQRKPGRIVVVVKESEEWALVSVTDNGEGISPEMLERLWEPFFTTKPEEGLGLGLAISKQIVERHNGRIEVDSQPGEGSTFTVHLPKVAPIPPAS